MAFDEEASRVNEQNILTISSPDATVVVRQIAGLIARRVLCWKKPGESLERGELIGLIRFGSRVDVTVPECVRIRVRNRRPRSRWKFRYWRVPMIEPADEKNPE